MAVFSIDNISLRGVAACAPKNSVSNKNFTGLSEEEIEKFIQTTGVENRRIAENGVCASDLCFQAAEKLIAELAWDKKDIDVLVFVSQSADYILPVTSALLQNRLGLSENCLAFDIPLGCSGYVYGMSVVASLMNSTKLKKGLLLVGDVSSRLVSPTDKSATPLFGDAGTASAFEYNENAEPIRFDLGTDGSGYQAIMIPDGGKRSPVTADSLVVKEYGDGISRNNCQLVLDGMDVFAFGINQAPATFNKLVNHFNIDINTVDHFIFHQANYMMNKMIVKKLKLPDQKVPYSLKNFGNTSSATLPLTILTELKDKVVNQRSSFILCGFGVGLSWGTVQIVTENLVCPDLIEI